jgi:hypothetical protein
MPHLLPFFKRPTQSVFHRTDIGRYGDADPFADDIAVNKDLLDRRRRV